MKVSSEAWRTDLKSILEQVLDDRLCKVVDGLKAALHEQQHREQRAEPPFAGALAQAPAVCKDASAAHLDRQGTGLSSSGYRASSKEHDVILEVSDEDEDVEGSRVPTPSLPSLERLTSDNEQLKDYMQVKGIEEHYEGLYEVTRAFNLLCKPDKYTISAGELVEMRAKQIQVELTDASLDGLEERFSDVILVANQQVGLLKASGLQGNNPKESVRKSTKPSNEISLDTFTMIMHKQHELCVLKESVVEDVGIIREILLKEETFRKVALCTGTSVGEIQAFGLRHSVPGKMQKVLHYMDPIIGVIILLNAVVIVISVDVARGHTVWDVCEVFFTAIFMGELILRITSQGVGNFFFGHDMTWNIFDTVVVLTASLDFFFSKVLNGSLGADLTLMRLLRFARLTRLVRVLKLKIFAELLMLVNGVVIGFRTLIWVVVFMLFLLIFIGVILTDALGKGEPAEWEICSLSDPDYKTCKSSTVHLQEHSNSLFGNLFRSMFTTFRCLTDGCTSMDGTPLIPHFLHTLGPASIICYMLVFIFVTFGLFNLIMAVFVENTLAGAKRLEAKRKEAQRQEHIRLARELHQLIVMFCHGEVVVEKPKGIWRLIEQFKNLADCFSTNNEIEYESEEIKELQLTQKVFCDVCDRPEVRHLFADLDIELDSPRTIFEILDANNNGTLEVTELVQGLLRLRGMGDRTEMVESLLAIKAMQRSLKAVEVLGLHQQELVQKLVTKHPSASAGSSSCHCTLCASLPTVPACTLATNPP